MAANRFLDAGITRSAVLTAGSLALESWGSSGRRSMRMPSSAPLGKESSRSLRSSPRRIPSSSATSNISQFRNLVCREKVFGNVIRPCASRRGPMALRMVWISVSSSGSIRSAARAPDLSERIGQVQSCFVPGRVLGVRETCDLRGSRDPETTSENLRERPDADRTPCIQLLSANASKASRQRLDLAVLKRSSLREPIVEIEAGNPMCPLVYLRENPKVGCQRGRLNPVSPVPHGPTQGNTRRNPGRRMDQARQAFAGGQHKVQDRE